MNIESILVRHKNKVEILLERESDTHGGKWRIRRMIPIAPNTKRYRQWIGDVYLANSEPFWYAGKELRILKAIKRAEQERARA